MTPEKLSAARDSFGKEPRRRRCQTECSTETMITQPSKRSVWCHIAILAFLLVALLSYPVEIVFWLAGGTPQP